MKLRILKNTLQMCCCFSTGGMHCACLEKKGKNREFSPKFGFGFEIKEDEPHFGAGDENQHTPNFQNVMRKEKCERKK